MSYINDPREMVVRPESGITLEQDNRVEEMYHWGAMIVDLCDLPVEEYMKPMTVIGLGGGGEVPETKYTLKFVIDGVVVYQESLKSGDPIPFTVNAEKDGRTFKGWFAGSTQYSEGSLMPSKSLTLTANYECNISFVFVVDGVEEVISSYAIPYKSKPSVIPSTKKDGYEFLGWEPSVNNYVTEHTTFKGTFKVIVYIVTWNGYEEGPIVNEYLYGETLIVPITPEKEGYTFKGWDNDIPEIVTSNLTFNANFDINQYNLSYHVMVDGEEFETLSSLTLNYGATISVKSLPKKSGYTYSNWEGYNADTNEVFTGKTMPAFNVKYLTNRTTNSYILSYYVDDILLESNSILYGEKIQPIVYEKIGYTVSEWIGLPEDLIMPYMDVNVYCTTQINSYTITFKDQFGNEYKTVAEYETPINTLIPQIEGKTFTVSEDILNSTVEPNDMLIEGIVTVNNYKVTVNGIDGIEYVMLPYETNIKEYFNENYPAEEGYNIEINSSHETVPANDNAIVTIIYNPNIWVLSYATIGGGEHDIIGEKELAYNTLILPELPETSVEGYNFGGWFIGEQQVTETDRMPNNDLIVNGEYTIKTYNVKVVDGETVILEDIYEYGTEISSIINNEIIQNYLNELEENGYIGELKINGENIDENLKITEDIEIHVERIEKEFTLTFMNGNEIISSESVKFNSIITYPNMENKTQDGIEYVFVWEDTSWNGKTMPSMDLVIVGNYQEKAEAPIYFGSFKVRLTEYDSGNTTQYFDASKVETDEYDSVAVADCIGEGAKARVPLPADPDMQGMTAIQKNKYLKEWRQPLCFLFPYTLEENYNIQLLDGASVNHFGTCVSDNEVVVYNGNEYKFYSYYNDNTKPVAIAETTDFTIILTKK